MSKLEIEIPVGKEVDWEASAKQKQIVLKNKQLTYQDVCEELFDKGYYYTDEDGYIRFNGGVANISPNNAVTVHQLGCMLAKNRLANVARYLNGEWKNYNKDSHYVIWKRGDVNKLEICKPTRLTEHANIIFKSKELAQQAIKILGEETIKLALEPLY